ncbi:unnamed protein product [Heligmosomoides polygyrus]|uniref:LZ_Tnp_IS66 domain-containing protein n=1 Tax=Heligmosomoides polygyrus TaxID=6339 RepID=A0A183G7M4_HELPZ|nr:unnamed protein product [Heligmosomoides polygyrus]
MFVRDSELSVEQIPDLIAAIMKEQELLQEKLRRKETELEELAHFEPQAAEQTAAKETPSMFHHQRKKGWLRKICERYGLDLAAAHAQLVTSWTADEENRAERVFDIDDTLNCLHEEFRCQSQKLLLLPEVPQMELSDCNVSVSVIAGDVIPRLPEPAYSHRVETVLEAARIIAIYQGCGTMREKILWILDPDRKLSRQRA